MMLSCCVSFFPALYLKINGAAQSLTLALPGFFPQSAVVVGAVFTCSHFSAALHCSLSLFMVWVSCAINCYSVFPTPV